MYSSHDEVEETAAHQVCSGRRSSAATVVATDKMTKELWWEQDRGVVFVIYNVVPKMN